MTLLAIHPPQTCAGYSAGCYCSRCAAMAAALAVRRASCEACHGDAELCNAGTSCGDRLAGCQAWTASGSLRPSRAAAASSQPWQPARAA